MKNNTDKQYLEFLNYILENGEVKGDRTGTGTISIFDYSMTFDMSEGFPLLTSKKVFTKAVIHELIWFLRGDTNIKYLVDNGVHIWDGDAYKNYEKGISRQRELQKKEVERLRNSGKRLKVSLIELLPKEEFINKIKTDDEFAKTWGELGPVYGKQWRRWGGYKKEPHGWHHGIPSGYKDIPVGDQISDLINDLKNNPDSRRLIVSAWNVGELDQMALPPCHNFFQCYTSLIKLEDRIKWYCDSVGRDISFGEDFTEEFLNDKNVPTRKLSLKWNQRSCDVPLGIPFNIASYGILLHLLAKEANMIPHQLKFTGGDCHIYLNQVEGVKEQLERNTHKLPKLVLSNTSIDELKYDDIKIVDYKSEPTISFPLSN
jgi:thymidylate synthase